MIVGLNTLKLIIKALKPFLFQQNKKAPRKAVPSPYKTPSKTGGWAPTNLALPSSAKGGRSALVCWSR